MQQSHASAVSALFIQFDWTVGLRGSEISPDGKRSKEARIISKKSEGLCQMGREKKRL